MGCHVHHLGAGVLVLTLGGEGHRERLTLGIGPHEIAGRVLHVGLGPNVAVDPLHRAALLDVGTLGDEVVDVVGPVLDGRVPASGVLLDDDLHDGGVQGVRLVDRCGASLDVVHVGVLVGDDEGALELAEVLGVHAEVRLQRNGAVHPLGHVDERSTRPHGGVEGSELVVAGWHCGTEVLLEQFRVLSQGSVGVEEDDALTFEFLIDLVVDDLGLVLGGNTGHQAILLGLGNAQTVVGGADVVGKVVPGLGLPIRGTHEVLDVVEVDRVQVDSPGRHRLAIEDAQRLESALQHPLRFILQHGDAPDDVLGEPTLGCRGIGVGIVPAVLVARQRSDVLVLALPGAGQGGVGGGVVYLGH